MNKACATRLAKAFSKIKGVYDANIKRYFGSNGADYTVTIRISHIPTFNHILKILKEGDVYLTPEDIFGFDNVDFVLNASVVFNPLTNDEDDPSLLRIDIVEIDPCEYSGVALKEIVDELIDVIDSTPFDRK